MLETVKKIYLLPGFGFHGVDIGDAPFGSGKNGIYVLESKFKTKFKQLLFFPIKKRNKKIEPITRVVEHVST